MEIKAISEKDSTFKITVSGGLQIEPITKVEESMEDVSKEESLSHTIELRRYHHLLDQLNLVSVFDVIESEFESGTLELTIRTKPSPGRNYEIIEVVDDEEVLVGYELLEGADALKRAVALALSSNYEEKLTYPVYKNGENFPVAYTEWVEIEGLYPSIEEAEAAVTVEVL